MQLFEDNIKSEFKVLFCYDLDDDNIFLFKDKLKLFSFEIKYIKNPSRGPCSAIKQGFKSGESGLCNCFILQTILKYSIFWIKCIKHILMEAT